MRATLRSYARTLLVAAAFPILVAGAVTTRSASAEDAAAGPRESHDHADGISHYTCSMHPSVRSNTPGVCPICSMDLVPVTNEEVRSGVVRVDEARRQRIGIETGRVERRAVTLPIRAVGRVTFDESRLTDVTLKVRGWIGRVFTDSAGIDVEKGERLFTIYAPELLAAQEELLEGLRRGGRPTLRDVARRRLRLWNVTPAQIDEIARAGAAREYLPILSPVRGTVIEKNVVDGSTAEAGARLYRIADLSSVWIEAEVHESDVPLVEVGQHADVRLSFLPGEPLSGTVSHVYPYLDGDTRTARFRIPLDNPSRRLRPDMYAEVALEVPLGTQLVVPEEAVLRAGERSLVFLDLGEGRLRPVPVEVGRKTPAGTIVLGGLVEGATVVTSGNFLIAAESKLKSGTSSW